MRLAQWKMPLLFAVALCFLSACAEEASPNLQVLRGQTMGTYWQVSIAEKHLPIEASALQTGIEAELAAVNQSMSTYIPDSELMRWNRQSSSEAQTISPELRHVVAKALQISAQSEGMYDVTVGPLVNLWGFGPDKVQTAPNEDTIVEVLSYTGYQHLQLSAEGLAKDHPQTQIDLSSIAKGYGVDRVADYLQRQGLQHFIIDIGGEVRMQGNRFGQAWRIGVEMPKHSDSRELESVIRVQDRQLSMATSGNYRNFLNYEGMQAVHTINPKTGKGAQSSLLSVTVLHEDCMSADAYATALMALGDRQAEDFAARYDLAVLFIFAGEQAGEFTLRTSPRYESVLKGDNP